MRRIIIHMTSLRKQHKKKVKNDWVKAEVAKIIAHTLKSRTPKKRRYAGWPDGGAGSGDEEEPEILHSIYNRTITDIYKDAGKHQRRAEVELEHEAERVSLKADVQKARNRIRKDNIERREERIQAEHDKSNAVRQTLLDLGARTTKFQRVGPNVVPVKAFPADSYEEGNYNVRHYLKDRDGSGFAQQEADIRHYIKTVNPNSDVKPAKKTITEKLSKATKEARDKGLPESDLQIDLSNKSDKSIYYPDMIKLTDVMDPEAVAVKHSIHLQYVGMNEEVKAGINKRIKKAAKRGRAPSTVLIPTSKSKGKGPAIPTFATPTTPTTPLSIEYIDDAQMTATLGGTSKSDKKKPGSTPSTPFHKRVYNAMFPD